MTPETRVGHHKVTLLSAIFGFLLAAVLFFAGAATAYWVATLAGVVVVLGARTIVIEYRYRAGRGSS